MLFRADLFKFPIDTEDPFALLSNLFWKTTDVCLSISVFLSILIAFLIVPRSILQSKLGIYCSQIAISFGFNLRAILK